MITSAGMTEDDHHLAPLVHAVRLAGMRTMAQQIQDALPRVLTLIKSTGDTYMIHMTWPCGWCREHSAQLQWTPDHAFELSLWGLDGQWYAAGRYTLPGEALQGAIELVRGTGRESE